MPAAEGDLLLVIATGALDAEGPSGTPGTLRNLLAQGYEYHVWDPFAFSTGFVIWKIAEGGEENVPLVWAEDAAGPASRQQAVLLQLADATPDLVYSSDSGGDGDVFSFGSVDMLGEGRVLIVGITDTGYAGGWATPAGYTAVYDFDPIGGLYGSLIVAQSAVGAGTESPPASTTDPGTEWFTMTVGIHGTAANVMAAAYMDLVPLMLGPPPEAIGDERPPAGPTVLAPVSPFPPDPTSVEVPGPPWETDDPGPFRPGVEEE